MVSGARYCSSCGSQAGLRKEVFQVSPNKLIEKFKDVVKDANVKRVLVKNEHGETILSIPVTWGAAGAVATLALAPWLAALGAIAAIATKCTIEVERTPPVTAPR